MPSKESPVYKPVFLRHFDTKMRQIVLQIIVESLQ